MNFSFLEDTFVPVVENAKIADYTTFQLGGSCKALITCQTPYQLQAVVKRLVERNIDFILIGGGSNLLVSDEGIDCVVVRYIASPIIASVEGQSVTVSGSSLLDALVKFALEHSLEGINYASGIPGTVGGAVVGNAGAFGKQVGDVLESVLLMDKKGMTREAKPSELGFRYRHSNLKETGEVVVAAHFALRPGDKNALLKERNEILAIRHEKHPDLKLYPCAGSFFRNIEPTSAAEKRQAAGWFLEQAGGKNLKHGGATIFSKHANIIIKSNGCTAQDVYELSKLMAKLAKEKFDLDLVREVRFVGKFQGMPQDIKEVIW